MMLFSEVYSSYYKAIAKIIDEAIKGELSSKSMNEIIKDTAFAESSIDIPRALKSEKWPLIKSDMTTVINNSPITPLSLLEKRWLKSLLCDKRIKLFDISAKGLEDVEPLYTEDTFVRFDVYTDSDPYDDPLYIYNFRKILNAQKSRKLISITYTDNRNISHCCECAVDNIEYSHKNDRFRVIAVSDNRTIIINLSSISECTVSERSYSPLDYKAKRNKKEIEAILIDQNNALDRAMICFSYLEKETIRIDDTHYRFKLKYFEEDEMEIIIQILSFGTFLRVVSPQSFVDKLKDRISKQLKLSSKL